MANQIRIKRRASTGASGAPSSLKNAELAFNEADNVLYYGYGDDGNGNATSIIGIGGDGNVVSLSGTQEITGNKTYSGESDFTGPLKIDGVTVSATAAELNKLDGATITTAELNYLAGVSSNIQAQLNSIQSDVDQNESDADAGIAANEAHIDNLVSLSGVSKDDTDLGTFTGSTISDGGTVKAGMQELETAVESAQTNADSASEVKTQLSAVNANQYLTFVADNNVTPTKEAVRTAAGIKYNPSLNVLYVSGTVAAEYLTLNSVNVNATADEINILDGATLTTTELNYVDGVTSSIQTQIDAAVSDVADLRSLSGTADGDTDLGDFSGVTISANRNIKQALQELETSVETKGSGASLAALTTAVGDLNILTGVAQNSEDLGTFTGSTIGDNRDIKEALQDLETELEDGAGSLTADSGIADFADGTVTVAGGTGLSTSATGETLTVNLDDTTVTAGSYGSSNKSLTVSFDAQGRATLASAQSINIVHTQVSDFDSGVQTNRLDQMAQPTAAVAMNSQRLTGLADPVGDQDAATKYYVDSTATGLSVKESARAATTANITLSGVQTIDGVSLVAGDRVLVKNQTDASENGIYDVVSGNAWTRSSDADNSPSGEMVAGVFVFIEEGSVNADSGFILSTNDPIVLDETDLTFVQFSGAGQITAGAGMTKSGNQIDVGTASTARIVVNANDIDLATHGTAGTYNGLTVDSYGRVSSFTTPTTLAGYSITDAQPLDATLTALAGVSTSADTLIYSDGSDSFATTSLTAYSRSLLDDANATAARSTLGLGSMAIQNKTNVDITGGTIDGCSIDGGTF